ncbi:MAG TPA: NAD(P)-binding domain-containing protein [Archangium sp.]|uniref:NADPH-dependent F420 reductase n=1 Tax=Archangium sp. TaxID=1872627 RepID=UPI002E33E9E5|nr:NAD(P)-binding domain-containing protein [Archangium sp.]HEX5748820.1 NAD(P)-binding domain-containing protein [Archangium sp.]
MKIGILGSGNVAKKTAALFIRAGHGVLLGERGTFSQAAEYGEAVLIALPYLACKEVLPALRPALAGKIVIDATNPLNPDWSPVLLGEENSAGEEIARLLPESRVVKAFNTVFADSMFPEKLNRGGLPAAGFLCGNSADANTTVARLLQELGFAPIDAGPLRCARYLEAMAHLNIQLAVGMSGGTDAVFLYHQNKA